MCPSPSPAALLLDAGGTLLAEHPSREALYAAVAARHGRAVEAGEMGRCMHRAHAALPLKVDGNSRYSNPWFAAFIDRIFRGDLGLDSSLLPAIRRELFATFADARNFRLKPGARELVAAAQTRGWKLALVSNWSPAMEQVLAGLGLRDAFDCLVISAIEGVEKPDPEIFHRALARLNVPAARALHVGNEPVQDVRGAQAAGIAALLLDEEGRHAALGLASVRSLEEVMPWIDRTA